MKKISILFLLALVCSCSNSDDSSNSSSASINPPAWIQGYWLREVSDGEVTDLQGLKATSNDFYFTQIGSGNSMKTLINNVLLIGGTVVVDELISNTEYRLNITLNGSPFSPYYFKKISSTKIQIYDTAGVGGAFFIKQ